MRYSKLKLVLLLVTGFLFGSCSYEDLNPERNIYISGYLRYYTSQAVYWNSDKMFILSKGILSDAQGIGVIGSDIYVAGSVVLENSPIRQAVYWKNSELNILSDSLSRATSMTISGSDFYITGETNNRACYWKNGIPFKLSSDSSQCTAITISGSDVYAAGTIWSPPSTPGGLITATPVYWKNGAVNSLPNTSYTTAGIAVFENDVYVVGDNNGFTLGSPESVYWKNGILNIIPNFSASSGIAQIGTDVLIPGSTDDNRYYPHAGYLRNGVPILTSNIYTSASSICVSGSDVYLAGQQLALPNNSLYTPVYWKNGEMKQLAIPNSISYYTTAIFVK